MADELTKPLTPIDRVAARVVYGEKINYKPTYLRFRLNKKYKKIKSLNFLFIKNETKN